MNRRYGQAARRWRWRVRAAFIADSCMPRLPFVRTPRRAERLRAAGSRRRALERA